MSDSDHDPIHYRFGLCCADCGRIVRTKQAMYRHEETMSRRQMVVWLLCRRIQLRLRWPHGQLESAPRSQAATGGGRCYVGLFGHGGTPATGPASCPGRPSATAAGTAAGDATGLRHRFLRVSCSAEVAPQVSVPPLHSAASSPSDLNLGISDTDLDTLLARYTSSSPSAQPPVPATAPAAAAPLPAAAHHFSHQ